jgi:UDP-glucose 4-epimerase
MRIAVVGATGNVGTALLRRLRAAAAERPEGVDVVGIARRLPGQGAPYDGVAWRAVDVADPADHEALVEALTGCDAVVHLAWLLQPNRDEARLRRTNVDGTANVLDAAARAGVPHVVCASSVGAYSHGPKERRVSEDWPARGIATSHYSRFKGEQEAVLDAFSASQPDIRVARLRPGLIFQRAAGSEIARYFLGPVVPKFFLHRLRLPLLPFAPEFVFQAVHADDIADAYWRVLDRGAVGAFNVASEPVLGPDAVAALFGARRWLPLPSRAFRTLVGAAWSVGLVATDPGWVDMAAGSPVMDTSRARTELGWTPRHSSLAALRELLDGLGAGAGLGASPPLVPRRLPRRPGQGEGFPPLTLRVSPTT